MKFLDSQTWQMEPKDLAYRDPFSDNTHRIRRKLIFFSFLVVLNEFHPVDLVHSHLLGIEFVQTTAPPLAGILGLLTVFFMVEFIIYTSQELSSWTTQAKDSYRGRMTTKLDEVARSDVEIKSVIEKTQEWMAESQRSLSEIVKGADSEAPTGQSVDHLIKGAEDDRVRLNNWLSSIEKTALQYQQRLSDANNYLQQIVTGVRRAVFFQLCKVGVVEIVFPMAISIWAITISFCPVVRMLREIAG